ncbi:MAG: DNA polymerase II [Polyangiaceae bacterium]|nr:DNA polymerase II [Polyangiaceae bacterium]
MSDRGFLLTTTYRSYDDRTEVRLHAVLESGHRALIVDDRLKPYLFVREHDWALAARVTAARVEPTNLCAFDGESVARIDAPNPEHLGDMRDKLERASIEPLESDVRFVQRWLVDHGIFSSFHIDGVYEERGRAGRIYKNPRLTPARFVPRLTVMSFDIETSLDGKHLFSIASTGAGGDRVFIIHHDETTKFPDYVDVFSDERSLLLAFFDHVRLADPDVLTGWSLPDFDLPAIVEFCKRAKIPCELGRGGGGITIRRDPGFTREARAFVPGRAVLDGLSLVRGAFVKLDDYRLETAARSILGRGKLFGHDDRGAKIESSFLHDPTSLAEYNLEDARLVRDILTKLSLVELAVERSLLTGLPPDRVGGQIAAIDSLYLGALRTRGRVAPSVRKVQQFEPIVGGLVLDATSGVYRNVAVYDFKSLYPSIIRTFQIDPLTYVGEMDPRDKRRDVIVTPSKAAFRRGATGGPPGILPELVAELGHERSRARSAGDERRAYAIKILMNSMYGVLGAPASRLFSPVVANAIPIAGQYVIRAAARAVARRGYRVLYGDTDSIFVDVGELDHARVRERAEVLREQISADVAQVLREEFDVESHLELALQKVYLRLLLPELRTSAGGSKKRYAGLLTSQSGFEVDIVGLEAVRRDASPLSRRFQRELLEHVFHDKPVGPFVRAFVANVRAGRNDDELVLQKALRKPLEAYTKTTPPHVKAARRSQDAPGRTVSYVVTRHGPEPVNALTAPPDHEHYVNRELRPLADSILRLVGSVDFDDLIGAPKQLSLF